MGGKSDAPDVPDVGDYIQLAEREGQIASELLSQQTAANRPVQTTPFGTSVWTPIGDTGQWEQTVTLDPTLQRTLTGQQRIGAGRTGLAGQLMPRMAGELRTPIQYDPLTANPLATSEEQRQAAEDAIYERSTSRLDPYWEQREEELYNQLWNQGLRPEDEAWRNAWENMARERTDAYQTAMSESIIGGGEEAERSFTMDALRRQQAIAEEMSRRGATLGEINALTAGAGVGAPSFPAFTPAGVAQTPDLLGAAQAGSQSALDVYNAEQMQQQGLMSGLFGLGAAVIPSMPFSFSDRRLKTNVKRIGETPGGQSVYSYQMFGEEMVGVMADESPPEAVWVHPSGYAMVDYSRIR